MQLLENVFTFLTFQVGLGLIAYQEGETKGVTTIKPVPFVVGGNVTKPGEFPWLVNIRFEMEEGIEKLVCGGTLIELNIVLTAAHCLTNKTTGEMLPLEKLIVVAGDYKFQSYDKTEQKSRVEKYIIHEKFERGLNDIALIKLSKKLKPTWAVSPGFLPPFNVLELDKTAVVAGWGITENGKTSDILLKAEIPIVSDPELCEVNENLQICAGGDGHDSCDGDSGGPLMCVPGFLYICGIVSYGVGEDCGNEPGVYTNVYKYEDWIHKNKGFKPHPTQIPTLIVIGVIAFTLLAVVAIIVTFNQAFKGRNRTVTPQAGNVESDNLIVAEY